LKRDGSAELMSSYFKSKQSNMQKSRPRLTEDEFEIVKEYRNRNKGIAGECEAVGIDLKDVKHYWYKGEHYSINAKGAEAVALQDVMNSIIEEMKSYAPTYPSILYPNISDPHLLVISPADVHLNKLCSAFETGDEYTIEIACKRVKDGIIELLKKATPYNIDKILFIVGNDILHTDNAKSTTTSGTFQDTQLMWYDAFIIGKKLIVEVIEMLLTVAPVKVQYNPSNHDYTNGFFLAQVLESWFSKCDAISFDVSMSHRKYFVYGNNIVATTHGDGAKETDLALLMAHECSYWSRCKHKYFYIHHIHHKKSKDYMSVTVEALRSPSDTDSWHHRNGYQHAPKAIEAFLHHPLHGQICRLTHYF